MQRIAPGLFRLLGPLPHGVNAYLWLPEDAGGPILFDCGWPWSGRWLAEELRSLGCPPERLQAVVITHDDVDHTGRLASLHVATDATVYAHRAEIPRLERGVWRAVPGNDGPIDFVNLAGKAIYAQWSHPPVHGARAIEDGDTLPGDWMACHTPGHTPGHTSYFHAGLGVLIAGDALGPAGFGRLRAPEPAYSEDNRATLDSVRKLAALQPKIICCGHGPIIRNGAKVLSRLADQRVSPGRTRHA